MTGRRTARDQDDRPSGPPAGGARRDPAGPPRSAVAPHPRVVPAAAPPEPPPAPEPVVGVAPEPAVEVEPTTGGPVDAVPRRVPVRQPDRWRRRRGPAADGGTPDDGDGAYWPPIEQVHWDGTPIRPEPPPERNRAARPAARRTPHPPDPLPAMAALVTLSLVAAFFAWVSAGPFWVAVGHATGGTAVIVDCTGGGLGQRCRGTFVPEHGRWIAHGVRVSGVAAEQTAAGTRLPARMTGPDVDTAYADTGAARHLRWLLGLLVVLGCGVGTARWTGATRLPGPRARRWAVTVALAGPLLITLGFLAAAW